MLFPNAGTEMPLAGLKVIDLSTIFAGPLVASYMADFGADVIKVEHPRGDPLRTQGYMKDGQPLWWKLVSRNKRCVTLDLHHAEGRDLLRRLVADADVLIENFRPGTLEKWGVGWEVLHQVNPRLVMVRTTGFGQTGPYKQRPGFGTLAEAMSGFAYSMGFPDRPPQLPPFGLADTVAAAFGAFAVMFAIYHRDVRGSGQGQFIDLAILEPIFAIQGPHVLNYQQLGIIQERMGNRTPFNAPRNCFQCKDGHWVAISAANLSTVQRTFEAIGRPELLQDPRFKDVQSRLAHVDELDAIIQDWIGRHTREEVLARFEECQATLAPVYNIADIVQDPHVQAREMIQKVADPDLGELWMQDVFPRLSLTPGRIRWPGRALGADNAEVYGQLGLSAADLEALKAKGVI